MDIPDDGENNSTKNQEAGARGVGGSVPGHVMRRLQTLALRLVERYALLSEKDRGLTCRGLCQLWLAFSGPGQGDNLPRMVSEGGLLGDCFLFPQMARLDETRTSLSGC